MYAYIYVFRQEMYEIVYGTSQGSSSSALYCFVEVMYGTCTIFQYMYHFSVHVPDMYQDMHFGC